MKLPPEDYSREITGTRTEQRVKMNRMRLKIAQRLKDAQNTNAMLTTFNEIDMRYGIEMDFKLMCNLLFLFCLGSFLISCHLPTVRLWNSEKQIWKRSKRSMELN